MASGAIIDSPSPADVCGADPSQAPDLPDADALMVALILAPDTFSRNKFFRFYEDRKMWIARRRAQMVRSLIKELTEPWPDAGQAPARSAAVIEKDMTLGGELHLQFSVPDMGYRRHVRLSRIEAAAFRYGLYRAGRMPLNEPDRMTVEAVLRQLAPQLEVSPAPQLNSVSLSSPSEPPPA